MRHLTNGPKTPPMDRVGFNNGYMASLDVAVEYLEERSSEGHNEVAVSDFMQHLTDQRDLISGFHEDDYHGQRLGYTDLLERLYRTLDSLTTGCSRDDRGLKQARILDMLTLVSNARDMRSRKFGALV